MTIGGSTHRLPRPVHRHGHAEPDRVRRDLSRCRRPSSTGSYSASALAIRHGRRNGRSSNVVSERQADEETLSPVVEGSTLIAMQQAIEGVHVGPAVGHYMVDLVAATRSSPQVQVGASPRGSLALLKLSRCRAALAGRDFVIPEDVKAIAIPALSHRLMLRPELWAQRVRGEDVVKACLDAVPTPPTEEADAAAR